MSHDYIHTGGGRHFEPLNPDPALIDIRDIAHALAMQCRWQGHVRQFYSVAEHSVRVSMACATKDALAGLLHDASEAYLQDVARPIKQAEVMAPYREAEARLMAVIATKFGVGIKLPPSVVRADELLLLTEARDLVSNWSGAKSPVQPRTIRPLGPEAARTWFMERFRALTKVAA